MFGDVSHGTPALAHPCVSRQQGRLLLLSAGWRLPTVVVQAAVHFQRRCSTCILRQAFGAHHSASPRASLAAGSETDNIPSLCSDTPLPQRISAGVARTEHSSDSRSGKTPSSTVVHNYNACRSAGAEIYPRWWCFPRRCTACMEQSTAISSNCILPLSLIHI